MLIRKLSVVALALVVVAGCADMQGRQNQAAGTLIGGAAGGLAGAQFGSGKGQLAATAIGAVLGAVVGSNVGSKLDEVDRMRANQAHTQALNTNETITWNNPDTGHHGSVVPVRSGTTTSGQVCREFQTTIVVGGQEEQGYGTACQQPDGSWKIVSN